MTRVILSLSPRVILSLSPSVILSLSPSVILSLSKDDVATRLSLYASTGSA